MCSCSASASGAEPYGLHVVQVQIAERAQGPLQGPRDRCWLPLVLGRLARRPLHQLTDELAQLPLAEPLVGRAAA
ncbi:hypothetical protein OHT51_19030 [Streptomyces sp. NBC_00299]|nr:hypothetical protein [Streptomyces sp. NBC_00299]